MFESLIPMLEELGVSFEEDYDTGTLTIDVASIDKIALISVIAELNNAGMPFTIDDQSIVVEGGMVEEPAMDDSEQMDIALDEMMNA
jgi:hypothetical protein